jgi:glycosyltransferase involved in cell wall biosynthesis
MLRVVMISPLPPEKAGESTYAANLIQEITKTKKIRVDAIAGIAADDRLDNNQVTTHRIWNERSLMYPFHLFREISRLRPHIVHVQFGPHGEKYGGMFGEPMLLLLFLLRLAGMKTTMTLHSTWMPAQVKARIGQHRKLGFMSTLAIPFFILFMKLLKLGISVLQLSTVRTNSLLRKRFLASYGYESKKVLEIPHPCGPMLRFLDRERALKQLNLTNQKVVLLFGFVRRGKGIKLAIDAINLVRDKVNNVLLLIAGVPQDDDGYQYLDELKDRVKRNKLDDVVRFDTKYISEGEIGDYLSVAVAILVPYSESVGASGPIHNFAIYGIPIIASDAGHHMKETLGGNILIFRNQDVENLASVLHEIITDDRKQLACSRRQIDYASKETWQMAGRRTIRNYITVLLDKDPER